MKMLIFTSLDGMSGSHNYIWFCNDTKKHKSVVNHREKYWSYYVISHDEDNRPIAYKAGKNNNWINAPYKHIKW